MENVLLGTKKIVTKIDKKTCNVHEKNKKNPVKSKEIEKKWVCKKLWKMQCLLVNLSIKLYIYIYIHYVYNIKYSQYLQGYCIILATLYLM